MARPYSKTPHGAKRPVVKRVKPEVASLAPDISEEENTDIDNIIPTRGYQELPMIGLGGSAGSIAALRAFFEAMPEKCGFVFVVVIHLSPEHESTLAEVLARSTSMPVVQAVDGHRVQTDHVYVIPPSKHLTLVDGSLRLTDLEKEHGRRVAVDLFFRSLADTHGPHASAIVLSGLDGDGALGIKRIKERGGLTIAQDPNEAEHSGMPTSAIETGMVDWVLKVEEMPARLLAYQKRAKTIEVPSEEAPPDRGRRHSAATEASLQEVLAFVRTRTGRDFSYYKRATIVRRISRRMQVTGVDDLPAYLSLLRTNPGEAGALLKDLLISVTNFFRDRDAFNQLAKRIPDLFHGKNQGDALRVWVPACATGEEVYSIAMLLLEHARTLDFPPAIQVFGCDLDDDSIQVARAGVYPTTIAADVSEERLRRFFIREHDGYRVRRELRELVLFAVHDLLKDAPFSRMDLISCRNLLIYLSPDAQKRAMAIFHFALKLTGVMFLGTSESVEDGSTLFTVLDKKYRLYAPRPSTRVGLPVPRGPGTLSLKLEEQARAVRGPVLPGPGFSSPAPHFAAAVGVPADHVPWGEVHYQLIERFAPPSLVVNADYDIQHMSESAGRFIQIGGGAPTMNLLRLVHPMLRIELRALLFRAAQTGETAEALRVPVEIHGKPHTVNLRVFPAGAVSPDYLLVIFDSRPQAGNEELPPQVQPEPVVKHLEQELEQMKRHLRDTVEQYEANNEELKASNEELQAMNEELRSATEELETSREELQSINEELTTVNTELKGKVDELAHSNSDLQNLMASTAIATVFLDRQLQITRFTPPAVPIFHLIPSDIGRPLSDLRHRLDYQTLRADGEQVLASLMPLEREVHEPEGRSYLARLLPYRTVDDRIAGLVLTFVDITERLHAEQALRFSEERFRLVIESAKDYAIFTLDTNELVSGWNAGAQAMFGYSENEIVGQPGEILFTPEDRAKGEDKREIKDALENGRGANERWHIRRDQTLFYGSGSVMPLRDPAGRLHGFVKIMRDLTESKRTEEAMRAHVEELTRFNRATEGRELRMIELKKQINELCVRLGEPAPHALDFESDKPEPRGR